MLNGILIGAAIPDGVELISTGVEGLVVLLQLSNTKKQTVNKYWLFKRLHLSFKFTKQNNYLYKLLKFE